MNNLIWKIKQEFESALQEKTSWGRNDIQKMYDDIVISDIETTIERMESLKKEMF